MVKLLDLMRHSFAMLVRCRYMHSQDALCFRARPVIVRDLTATGWSSDLSFAVMDRALFSCTNAYNVGAMRARGRVCRTNLASHTAFRGFGSPQGMFVIEHIIDRIAQVVGKTTEEVRLLNFINDGT